jgi:hypothetical protein
MSDSEFEPVPGLPERLPAGECMLWQGAPHWLGLALTAFRLREIAIYFALLMVWRGGSMLYEGASVMPALDHAIAILPLAFGAIAILLVIAITSARTTVYTITDRRIVMRFGMALPLTVNIPFTQIDAAAVGHHRGGLADGLGDITLSLGAGERIGYLMIWPHARPWRYSRPEPMLRSLPNPDGVAALLADALAAHAGVAQTGMAPRQVQAPSAKPVREPDMHGAPAPMAS